MAEQLKQVTASTSENIPHEEYLHEGRLKIVIAGLDKNIRTQALEAADRRLSEETGEKGGLGGWIKNNVWKKGLARRHYETRYRHAAQKEIVESGNLYHHEEGVSAEDYARGTTLRLMHDFTKDELDETRREIRGTDDDTADEKDYQLKNAVFRLVEKYASGELDKENFEENKKRLFKDMVEQGLDRNELGEGLLTTDNLFQVAQNVKAMVAHRQATGEGGIDEIWKDTDIVIGTANVGARTEVHQSWTDRVVDKLEKKGKSSDFIDEAMIGTAAVSALTVGAMAARQPLMSLTAGAAGGVFAGVRANNMVKRERTMDARATAVGKQGAEMFDESRYETIAATDMIQAISELYDDEGVLRVNGQAGYEQAMKVLAEVEARRNLSDSEGIDLISFSSMKNIEQERFDLDLALAKAKADVRRSVGFASWDESFYQAQEGILNQEMIQQKDRIFRKMKRRKVAKAVAIATVLSAGTAGIGVGAQLASDALSDQASSHVGDIDASSLSSDVFTPPQGAIELSGETHVVALGEYTKVNLPTEFTIETNADQTLTITGPDGMELKDLTLNDNGQLSAESQNMLQAAGVTVGVESGVVSEAVDHEVQVTGKEFAQQHDDLTTEIDRAAWYDNGTPGVAEGSELTLQVPERDSDGNIHIAVGDLDMVATSSTGESISLQDAAANGDIKIAVSASGDTQADVFLFDGQVQVDADGEPYFEAVISHDHPATSSLFDQNGEFKGAFIEGVIDNGVNDQGATSVDVFATSVGPDTNDFTDTISELHHHNTDTYTLDFNDSTASSEVGADAPPTYTGPHFIPFIPGASLVSSDTNRGERRGRAGVEHEARIENLSPISRVEAVRQMEQLKPGQIFQSELNIYKGILKSMGPPIGNTYVFARVDEAGKQLPGKPAFYFLTRDQTLDRLQQGRLLRR